MSHYQRSTTTFVVLSINCSFALRIKCLSWRNPLPGVIPTHACNWFLVRSIIPSSWHFMPILSGLTWMHIGQCIVFVYAFIGRLCTHTSSGCAMLAQAVLRKPHTWQIIRTGLWISYWSPFSCDAFWCLLHRDAFRFWRIRNLPHRLLRNVWICLHGTCF